MSGKPSVHGTAGYWETLRRLSNIDQSPTQKGVDRPRERDTVAIHYPPSANLMEQARPLKRGRYTLGAVAKCRSRGTLKYFLSQTLFKLVSQSHRECVISCSPPRSHLVPDLNNVAGPLVHEVLPRQGVQHGLDPVTLQHEQCLAESHRQLDPRGETTVGRGDHL